MIDNLKGYVIRGSDSLSILYLVFLDRLDQVLKASLMIYSSNRPLFVSGVIMCLR